MPNLPSEALAALPDNAQQQLIVRGPFETYSTIAYEGVNGGTVGSGLFVEVDEDTWVENNLFVFQEIKETTEEVILYDSSREVTVLINLITNDLYVQWSGNELVWDVTSMSKSLTPDIPDGWLL